jgi:hypothetical protein
MAARKRGRPKGSVNKKTVAKYNRLVKKYGKAKVDAAVRRAETGHKKRGRPKGSKNKTHHRKPGRPKGSKNKTHHRKSKTKTFHAHGVKVVVTAK